MMIPAEFIALWLTLVALLFGGSVLWVHCFLSLVLLMVLLVLLLLLVLVVVLVVPTLPSLLCCVLLKKLAKSRLGPCSPLWRPT